MAKSRFVSMLVRSGAVFLNATAFNDILDNSVLPTLLQQFVEGHFLPSSLWEELDLIT